MMLNFLITFKTPMKEKKLFASSVRQSPGQGVNHLSTIGKVDIWEKILGKKKEVDNNVSLVQFIDLASVVMAFVLGKGNIEKDGPWVLANDKGGCSKEGLHYI